MRHIILAAALGILIVPASARAQERSEVSGFGGVTFGTSTFGTAASSTFGGRVAVGLGDNLQLIGEGGRMADIKSPIFDFLDFTGIGARVSAYYGEAGVRFLISPRSAIRPYAEATAGFAKLSATINGLDGTAGAILNTGLNFVDSTRPMLGVGGGILVQSGPLSVDLGYRYKQISAGNSLAGAFNSGGGEYHVNQVRVGLGVRF